MSQKKIRVQNFHLMKKEARNLSEISAHFGWANILNGPTGR